MSDKANGFHARTRRWVCGTCGNAYTCGYAAEPKTCANCLTKQEDRAKAKNEEKRP